MKDFLTVLMSGISLSLSLWLYFQNIVKARMNLGVDSDFCIDSNEQKILFVRMSFINHSSKPITIKYMKLFDEKKQKFAEKPQENKYRYDDGDCIPVSKKILPNFKFKSQGIEYFASVLPNTIAPYSSSSEFYSFCFENSLPSIVSEKNNLSIYIETTEGSFYYPVSFGSKSYEYRNNLDLIESYKTYHREDTIEYEKKLCDRENERENS